MITNKEDKEETKERVYYQMADGYPITTKENKNLNLKLEAK